jgi:hypothetical protein
MGLSPGQESSMWEQIIGVVQEHYVASIIAVCFLAGMTLDMVKKVFTTMAQEKSRREIAAYIAEGSMTPEQGERLIRADINRGPSRHC